jgi:hypothetical protein
VAALAPRRPATQAGHIGRKPALVDEDQVLGGELGLTVGPALACRLYVRTRLLAGMRSLFLCVWPRRSRNFQTAVQTTRTPRAAASRSAISSSVVSGFSRSTPRMKASWDPALSLWVCPAWPAGRRLESASVGPTSPPLPCRSKSGRPPHRRHPTFERCQNALTQIQAVGLSHRSSVRRRRRCSRRAATG